MATQIESLERLFQALGDPTRLRIIGLLLEGEVCVCDLHASLDISQPKVSRHLAALRRAGLVVARRNGLWIHYRLTELADPRLAAVVAAVAAALPQIATVRRDAAALSKTTGCVGAPERTRR
jgi:ArsR family transcriptional regulator, arsenate/arsenite/antimonite-responsive transcriptional repressor